ncbi:taurine catabolism dioxygenase TauD, TfdA family [mine drainage metagenome]|uniref:Taurine catabolism dioxygenase TauD, TfdA family n=1 Tax=mine drainage metagenome TaxID=410659 RepID=A0A1J5PXT1_9ZZZZ
MYFSGLSWLCDISVKLRTVRECESSHPKSDSDMTGLPSFTSAAVEAFEAAAHDEDVCLEHPLPVGKMVFVDNRSVLQARRNFVDHSDDDPSHNRMLWRLWCS